jgi:hypothetical protein
MTELSAHDIAHRAERAKALLDDPVLTDAFVSIEVATIEELLALPPEADDKRRHLSDRVNTIRAVREIFRTHVQHGAMLAAERPRRTA